MRYLTLGGTSTASLRQACALRTHGLRARRPAGYDLQLTLTRYDLQLTLTRYDLQLDLAPPVRHALAELLETVEPLVARALGADAEYATASSQRAAIYSHA